jgi:hypothetical protein
MGWLYIQLSPEMLENAKREDARGCLRMMQPSVS